MCAAGRHPSNSAGRPAKRCHREIELSIFRRAGDRWRLIIEAHDAGFPEVGDTHGGGWSASYTDDGGYVWTFGREEPGHVVRLTYEGAAVEIRADDAGWWIFVREALADSWQAPVRSS
jgi:hypothetical protein